MFNVRATYQLEADKAVQLLQAIWRDRVGVLYPDDSFGRDALSGARNGFAQNKIRPVYIEKFDRSKPDFTLVTPEIIKTTPDALVIFGSRNNVVDAARAGRAARASATLVTLSNNASAGFVKALGEYAKGAIVSQVFPGERASALFSEVARAAKIQGITEVSPAMLEGYAAPVVLVQGPRRAGTNPTGPRLQAALEATLGFDVIGMKISYSATDHTG